MPLDLTTTATWAKANDGCGALAEAVHTLRGEPDKDAKSAALILFDEARKSLSAAISLIDSQVADLGKQLQTH